VTFRQIIAVLWQRKWLIVAVVAVALVVAGGYLALQVKSYTTTATARTSITVTNGASGGELDGVQVDFDPTTITAPKILKEVATATGSSETEIANAVSYEVVENKTTNTLQITAIGPTPQRAQERANSVVKVYSTYLQQQITKALATLTARQKATNALAVQYEQETNANLRDSIAAANLNNALADLGTLNTQIQSLTDAGAPLTPLTETPVGTPTGPGVGIVLAIALAAGLIAGIGIALIRDQFDDRLRGEHEIEPLTGLPSLGELSLDKTLRRKREQLPAAHNDQTQLSESLRSLRTSIQVLLPRNNAVLVVTSVEPGDGKTFITANVAVAWARTGKKVIVVGGDLRRPTLATYFGDAADGPGLSEILSEATGASSARVVDRIESYLADTRNSRVRVLPAGFEASDPADILASSALRDVIETLRRQADIVIFDSPPALALIDASLLAENADGIIVIASVGRTDRSSLLATVDLLNQNGAKTLGVVANRSRRRLPKSYVPYYTQRSTGQQAAAGPTKQPTARTPASVVGEEEPEIQDGLDIRDDLDIVQSEEAPDLSSTSVENRPLPPTSEKNRPAPRRRPQRKNAPSRPLPTVASAPDAENSAE
jgi:capsular exopolysaccharide synthesis family protein